MLLEDELDGETRAMRLLETDTRIRLPILMQIRILVTSRDVIHS